MCDTVICSTNTRMNTSVYRTGSEIGPSTNLPISMCEMTSTSEKCTLKNSMRLFGGTVNGGIVMRRVEEIENREVMISGTEWDGDSVYGEVQRTVRDTQKIIQVREPEEQSLCATDSLLPVKSVDKN